MHEMRALRDTLRCHFESWFLNFQINILLFSDFTDVLYLIKISCKILYAASFFSIFRIKVEKSRERNVKIYKMHMKCYA